MEKGTIEGRDAFLDHIAEGLGRPRQKHVDRPRWEHQPQQHVYEDLSQKELVEVFEHEAEQIDIKVRKTGTSQLPEMLEEVMAEHGGGPVMASGDERIRLLHLEAKEDMHKWNAARGEENIALAEKANIGLVCSDITLAESATVALFSDTEKGRSVSLLPRTLIALVPKSTIVPRMTQAAEQIHEYEQTGSGVHSCISFVSGPSNSSDIEMSRVVGVHGPVEMSCIIVEDQ